MQSFPLLSVLLQCQVLSKRGVFMKFCQHCGKEIVDEAVVCTNCGCSVVQTNNVTAEVDDTVDIGLVVLSVLIPLFGIIYWPLNAKTRPKCASACGIAAIISWVICFLFSVIIMAAVGI